jgi:integrase
MSALASPAMPRRLPQGCVEDLDRHGNVRIYYRAKGKRKARIRGTPWTPEFMAEYDAAKGVKTSVTSRSRTALPSTWRWLCIRYFAECADYLRLDPRTQRVRRQILEGTFDEPVAPASSRFFRDFPLSRMTADAVEVLRDRKLDFPEGANSRVKAIRAVFKWAVRKKGSDGRPLAPTNPARDVPYLKSNNPSGYHTWTLEEVHQYEEHHPIGTKARLAYALLLLFGQRRSDVTRLGRQHVRGNTITFTQYKGRNREPKQLTLPILPALQEVIDSTPCGDLTFLVNDLGRPFTDAGFGNKFREWCDQAGLHHCTAHGLRKAGATIAANNGATAFQLMAIFGWSSLSMAEKYTRKANQERLARSAMHMLEAPEQIRTVSCPTEQPSGTILEKRPAESKSNFGDGARGGNRTPTPCGTRF